MKIWLNSEGATLEKLREHGNLWVFDQLPPKGTKRTEIWEVTAMPGDKVITLITKYLESIHYAVPRTTQQRLQMFFDAASYNESLVIVVRDAHVLRGNVIGALRQLAEKGLLVVLVGDPALIDVATRPYPDFYQRALYCVKTANLFS